MAFPKSLTRTAGICLLFLALTSSGCSTIGEMIAKEMLYSRERSEDDAFCTKRCAALKGDDYVRCHKLCVSDERERRREMKAQAQWDKDRSQSEKSVLDEARRIRQK